MLKNNLKRSETFASKDSSATKIADSPYFVFFARVVSFKKEGKTKVSCFFSSPSKINDLGPKNALNILRPMGKNGVSDELTKKHLNQAR